MKILLGIGGLSFLALVACASNQANSPLPFFPQVAPPPPGFEEPWLLSAFSGELVVEDGCVKLRSPKGSRGTTVLWYQGIELDRDSSGLFLRVDGSEQVTRFNVSSDFGGGEAPTGYIDGAYPEVARRCGPPYLYGYPTNAFDAP
jgi:hypothetical protein